MRQLTVTSDAESSPATAEVLAAQRRQRLPTAKTKNCAMKPRCSKQQLSGPSDDESSPAMAK